MKNTDSQTRLDHSRGSLFVLSTQKTGIIAAVSVGLAVAARPYAATMSGQGLLLSMGALRCCWIGANLAISFMEAPVKFLAPLPSRRGLVDVGRHVFSALNKVEVVLATFDLLGWYFLIQRGLVPTASSGGSNASFFSKLQLGHLLRMTPGLVVYLCQSFAYLPVMRSIGTEYVEGRSISSAKTHGIYVLFEVIKMSTLVMGTASIAHALLA